MEEFAVCYLKFAGIIFTLSVIGVVLNELRLFIKRKLRKRKNAN